MDMKLALGSGNRNYGIGWIHVDAGKFDHTIDLPLADLPYEDNSVDLIYASHLIAYFKRDEFRFMLKEWYRVLKRDGVLRIATPDFFMMTELYREFRVTLNDILGPLYGHMKMGEEHIQHVVCYDHFSLSKILIDSGFVDVGSYDWRLTEHSHIDDHSQAYLAPKGDKENGTLISLNIQCKKP